MAKSPTKKETTEDDGLVEMTNGVDTLGSHPMHVDAWIKEGYTVVAEDAE